jgi:hypothetical protein
MEQSNLFIKEMLQKKKEKKEEMFHYFEEHNTSLLEIQA